LKLTPSACAKKNSLGSGNFFRLRARRGGFYIAGALVDNMTTTFTTPYLQGMLATHGALTTASERKKAWRFSSLCPRAPNCYQYW